MVGRETGKQRAARIPYNYLRTPDRFISRRMVLSLVALCAAGAWVAWGLLDRDEGRSRVSHGPLTLAHAAWETRCDACHAPAPDLARTILAGNSTILSAVGDRRCQACHMGDARQIHHDDARADRIPHCAECHRDHAGRDASLLRLDESTCTSCHRDLDAVLTSSPALGGIKRSIAHFADGSHPPFRSEASDPGRLKFNHALHMTPGLLFPGSSGRPKTFADLSLADRRPYGWRDGVSLDTIVRLDCSSCHHLDAGPAPVPDRPSGFLAAAGRPVGASPARGNGAYYLPVAYENDCIACHPLAVPGRSKSSPSVQLAAERIGGDTLDRGALTGAIEIPHHLQPAELTDLLRTLYLGLLLEDDPGLALDERTLRLPGRRPLEDSARREVAERAASAANLLLGRGKASCTECHHYRDTAGQERSGPEGLTVPREWKIEPTRVPARWLEHGRFDHSSHRAIDCRSCHGRAYRDDPKASGKGITVVGGEWRGLDGRPTWASNADVLLPGIEDCKVCHSPPKRGASRTPGGASYRCTECHTYHNGGHPEQGRGAAPRGVPEASRMDFHQFLLGAPSEKRAR